ncbi:MFS transporter [Microbacterium sp. ASV81]|uniref:MFS transporter n=1 Tax=Microbacterium capsulatum TaxID=3041921 RepID=A0ABU0XBD9_9MICO|nr:MFS transporter [Microbacterium sp. ASV81]MDQ4212406.1 MFS transporter [Microbacterium sp. ASV81]
MSSQSDRTGSAARAFALGAALLVGINLRPAITSVSTLLDQATRAFALTGVERSLLATLPVIAFGLTAPLGPMLSRRIGTSRSLLVAMAVLAVALVTRVLAGWMLLPGTFLAGAAIMVAATLLPPYLKSLDASGLWVGLSSMSFGVGAALGAGFAVPLDSMLGGVAPALAAWALLAVLAALAMIPIGRGDRSPGQRPPRIVIDGGNRLTMIIMTAVFSLQALLYFAVTTWLPLMLASHGENRAVAGLLLGWFSLIGLIPTLVAPVIARRRRILTWFGPGLGIVMGASFAWFAFDAGSDVAIVTILGIAQNAGFGLAMGLLVSLAADAPSAGLLSAIAQGVGYIVAGGGSLLFGVVHDATGAWTATLVLMALCGASLSAVVALVIRRRPVSLVAR